MLTTTPILLIILALLLAFVLSGVVIKTAKFLARFLIFVGIFYLLLVAFQIIQ